MIITSKYTQGKRAEYLGILYLSYLSELINWEEFVSYSEMIDRFLLSDFEVLKLGNQMRVSDEEVSDSLLRLMSLGLFVSINKDTTTQNTVGTIIIPANSVKDYYLTSFGEKMRKSLRLNEEL